MKLSLTPSFITWKNAYGENINAGTGTILIIGKGDYSETQEVIFEIRKVDIIPSISMPSYIYGEEVSTPVVSGNYGNANVTYYSETSI